MMDGALTYPFFRAVSGESNTQVEDMDEDSSSEDSDDESDEEGPSKAGGNVASVDSAPAVSQPPPPSLPTPGNVEVLRLLLLF